MASLRVLISGAGIGGLCLARALHQRGINEVSQVEIAPAWQPLGAGIVLGANAAGEPHPP